MFITVLIILVLIFLLLHGFLALRAGIRNENKNYSFSIGDGNPSPRVSNIFYGVLVIIAGIGGLIVYIPKLF